MSVTHKVVIIGSGPAGLTAGIYTARACLEPLIIEGNDPGGQLTITTDVENYPGYPDSISGPKMIEDFRRQAERFGTTFKRGHVAEVQQQDGLLRLELADSSQVITESLIIATGASARWLGLDSEYRLLNKGVSACATCDGFFFRNKVVAVVGGGDTAMEEALFLTRFASHVYVIHRRDELRASQHMQNRAKAEPKIEFIWNTEVSEVLGSTEVTGLELSSTTDSSKQEIAVDGLFVAIGHVPNSGAFKNVARVNDEGYILVKAGRTHTDSQGVFACGDVVDNVYRQAVTAAGMGCMAAIDAERWLASR